MLFPTIVDVSIGLMLVYVVLSVISTSVNEAIAALLRLRGRLLFQEVNKILDEPIVQRNFWRTGIMRSISRKENETGKNAPSYVETPMFARALITALATSSGKTPDNPSKLVEDLEEGSALQDVIRGLAQDADDQLEKFKDGVGDWFDRVMDRTSGVYKRYMTLLSAITATLIVIAVDADTVEIGKSLWRDDALRKTVSEQAVSLVGTGSVADLEGADPEKLEKLLSTILPEPLGWDSAPTDPKGWLQKGFGLLLTSFAVMLGAPFWFDLLQRFVPIRTSGPLRNH